LQLRELFSTLQHSEFLVKEKNSDRSI